MILIIFDVAILIALSYLTGCASNRRERTEKEAVVGPKSWGEVVEPDMAQPESD